MQHTQLRIPMIKPLTIIILLTLANSLLAATYRFEPEMQSIFGDRVQNNDFIRNLKPYTTVFDDKKPKVERCSFSPSQNRNTCDTYEVDRVEHDSNVNIKKLYVFRSQFDVQIFKDMSYIENNGRGGFQVGKCKLVAP